MNIEYKEIINELFGRQRAGIKPGLERTLFLLEALANPHLDLQCIHIAGTNGKGTCSSLLASYYMELGSKVGLYTSPHLVEFNERIRINGVKIPSNYIVDIYLELKDKIDEIDATFFEITTVIAFKYFAENNCDICIIETGMGGRFDCTNVINPLISIITSISIDHKEFLGDSLEQIAFEKAGIIKENTPVILGNINRKLEYIFEDIDKDKSSGSGHVKLTERQTEILALVAVGATNEEIADQLCISPYTVKTHLYKIFRKINVPNRIQASLWAAKHM